MEPLHVDPGRDNGDRQPPACRVLGLGGRVATGGDDVAGTPQHITEGLAAQRQSARNGDLGPVQHHVVGQRQGRADEPEWQGRVEHHQVGADFTGHRVDPLHHPWVRQQHRLAGALDKKWLLGIELGGTRVGAGEHGKGLGWEAAPPLPQQGLDATDLGRKVVGDEKMLHSAAFSSRSTSGWGSVEGIRWWSPRRRAAHTAWARSIGSGCER